MSATLPISSPTSVQILTRIAASQATEADWRELVARHGEAMRRAAALGTGGAAVIDDAVQETLLHLRRCAGRFQPRAAAEGATEGESGEIEVRRWLQRLTVNCAISLQRSEIRRHRREAAHAEMMMRDHHDHETPAAEQLTKAMQGLNQDERQVLLLRHVEGLDHNGLATALGTNEAAARKRLSRAHERLRQHLLRAGCALSLPALATHLHAASATALAPAPVAVWIHAAASGAAPVLPLHLALGSASAMTIATIVSVPLFALALTIGTVVAHGHPAANPPAPPPAATPAQAPPDAAPTTSWKPQAAGAYQWSDAANWTAAVPNAAGASAGLNLGRQGRMTITLARPVVVGRLVIGENTAGNPGKADFAAVTINGAEPLTFVGASAGAPTALTITQGEVPNGPRLELAAGIRLGGTSPLTVAITSPSVFACTVGAIDLGGNTFTLEGLRRFNQGDGWKGVSWEVGSLSGGGSYVQNGSGTSTTGENRAFTGSLVVNNGDFTAESLPAVSSYVVAGAFMLKHKYPRGGVLTIHAGAPLTPAQGLPARLNPMATLVFPGGGHFVYSGHTFDEQAYIGTLRPAVVERVRQIRFLSGMSELKVGNGNDVSSSTTLLASDPTEALVRKQGATVMIGGGDITSKQGYEGSLGMNERLDFASGIAQHLKGGGGPPGAPNRSIIPWMTIGTLYHPGDGGFATWDAGRGIHTLRKEEYSSTITGSPERNVRCDQLNLGTNRQQTVNSLFFGGWGNSDLGAGSTLTITSGALKTGSMGGTSIGKTPGAAGTIDFGAAEGVIWTAWVTPYGDTTIYSTLAGSGGLTKAASSTLILTAANTYTGTTCVAAGILQVGDGQSPAARLGAGDVEVANGASLSIAAGTANAVLDRATITLHHAADVFHGTVDLADGINEVVGGLVIDGKVQPAGTYGSTDSAAATRLDAYFTGRGILTVTGKAPARTAP